MQCNRSSDCLSPLHLPSTAAQIELGGLVEQQALLPPVKQQPHYLDADQLSFNKTPSMRNYLVAIV